MVQRKDIIKQASAETEREREREIALINDDGALLAARATRANSREIIR
jgi:hypothetical protein